MSNIKDNNSSLQTILDTINDLPNAGSGGGDLSDYYNKTETEDVIDQKTSGMMIYKGELDNGGLLPATGNRIGDTYKILTESGLAEYGSNNIILPTDGTYNMDQRQGLYIDIPTNKASHIINNYDSVRLGFGINNTIFFYVDMRVQSTEFGFNCIYPQYTHDGLVLQMSIGPDFYRYSDIRSLCFGVTEDVGEWETVALRSNVCVHFEGDQKWTADYILFKDGDTVVYTGSEKFPTNALESAGWTVFSSGSGGSLTTSVDGELVLKNEQEAQLGLLDTLIITMPSVVENLYHSNLCFTSGETATSLNYSATPILWVGDDCDTDGFFIPEANTRYEVCVKKLGNDIVARVGAY